MAPNITVESGLCFRIPRLVPGSQAVSLDVPTIPVSQSWPRLDPLLFGNLNAGLELVLFLGFTTKC